MTKTHDFSTFADDMVAIIRDGAASSNLGRTTRTSRTGDPKPLLDLNNPGTTCGGHAVRLAVTRTNHLAESRTEKSSNNQWLMGNGTTGTTGTSNFARDEDHGDEGGSPSEWHAILAELKHKNCPDWLVPDRWAVLLSDAETFLDRWGETAYELGWSTVDLFGVHPIAPAARFDVMGLILLLQGGMVAALTEEAATIRRSSNAILTYRRGDQTGAVCITRITP